MKFCQILEMQRREMIAQIEEGVNILNDQSAADEAERLAKAKEANDALEAEKLQIAEAIFKKTQAKSDDAWVLRSR